ncbi:10559_t:CDS:2 [Ambispora leptoticha]|uniref:10559_t:CDS:1 n=1 Tax=Ambispora leptoticha TaxID=144679 RepID=A0A9N9CUP5_9GLOM|nr:10559_t:CDS:2 [Ambispora leptoticha]
MKKLTALLVVLSSVFMVNAYCVYNSASIPVYVTIGSNVFTSFKQTLAPGTYGCCNWQNESCNPSKNKNETLPMTIESDCGCYYEGQIVAGYSCTFFGDDESCPLDQPTTMNVTCEQKNARLMAKIIRLEIENTDVKAKYDKAMNEVMKLRAELKNRIEKLEKDRTDTVTENTRCDDIIAKLKTEVVKLRNNNEKIK